MREIALSSLIAVGVISCAKQHEQAPVPATQVVIASAPPHRVDAEPESDASVQPALAYEAALNLPLDADDSQRREISDRELAGPLQDDSGFIKSCGATDDTKVTIAAVIEHGRVIGASVTVSPYLARVAPCIDQAIREKRWPVEMRRASFKMTF